MNSINSNNERILLAISGASGSIYADRLLESLYKKVSRVYVLPTSSGEEVAQFEIRSSESLLLRTLRNKLSQEEKKIIRLLSNSDLFSPVASGSSAPTQMVVLPCSMGTLARIKNGISQNLLERAADVMLKSRRPLILCPRETPLSAIHLDNMAYLAKLGVHIVPPTPGFYHHPQTITDLVDFVVGRILELMNMEHALYTPWNHKLK